ncbi:serine--tRNA ligase, mitochondrial [Galendromus occidentalis]|uniref:serine--tRNA ligase n=1 Tax=Galendromus occidentalis TaxID=34638 RepID=A0AAJ6QYB6_9ACAR|nr:serine--tRNA ligase, mitochondrial [Galendromus occidentalis]
MRKVKIDADRILNLLRADPSSEELMKLLRALPNFTHESVVNATSPNELEEFGQKTGIKKPMDESARSHGVLLQNRAYTTICGERAYFLTGDLARLERALVTFTVERLKKLDFKIISVPDLISADEVEACGMQPFGQRSQVYRVKLGKQRKLCLSGTAEIALANLFRDKAFENCELPLRLGAVSRCFRAEVSRLKEEKGLYRVHQFTKIEMFGFTEADLKASQDLQGEFAEIEKSLFRELGLHYKVLDMPPIDLGRPAFRKIDIEAWMSGHNFYGEISSTSDCTDFQSSRLGITHQGKYVHTVNGTACAIPRMLLAIGETHSTQDKICVPEVLRKYMDGRHTIRAQPMFKKWTKVPFYYLENREVEAEDAIAGIDKLGESC